MIYIIEMLKRYLIYEVSFLFNKDNRLKLVWIFFAVFICVENHFEILFGQVVYIQYHKSFQKLDDVEIKDQ